MRVLQCTAKFWTVQMMSMEGMYEKMIRNFGDSVSDRAKLELFIYCFSDKWAACAVSKSIEMQRVLDGAPTANDE